MPCGLQRTNQEVNGGSTYFLKTLNVGKKEGGKNLCGGKELTKEREALDCWENLSNAGGSSLRGCERATLNIGR